MFLQESHSVRNLAMNDAKGSLTKSYISFVERISKIKDVDKDKISTVGGFNEILNQLPISENSNSQSSPRTPKVNQGMLSSRLPKRGPIIQTNSRKAS